MQDKEVGCPYGSILIFYLEICFSEKIYQLFFPIVKFLSCSAYICSNFVLKKKRSFVSWFWSVFSQKGGTKFNGCIEMTHWAILFSWHFNDCFLKVDFCLSSKLVQMKDNQIKIMKINIKENMYIPEGPYVRKRHLVILGNTAIIGSVRVSWSLLENWRTFVP
jgi:hypothetical protein